MNETDKEIILAFAENNMNVCETARKSVYHRNSIDYHLRNIKHKTGLDPKRFYDLVELVRQVKGEEK